MLLRLLLIIMRGRTNIKDKLWRYIETFGLCWRGQWRSVSYVEEFRKLVESWNKYWWRKYWCWLDNNWWWLQNWKEFQDSEKSFKIWWQQSLMLQLRGSKQRLRGSKKRYLILWLNWLWTKKSEAQYFEYEVGMQLISKFVIEDLAESWSLLNSQKIISRLKTWWLLELTDYLKMTWRWQGLMKRGDC